MSVTELALGGNMAVVVTVFITKYFLDNLSFQVAVGPPFYKDNPPQWLIRFSFKKFYTALMRNIKPFFRFSHLNVAVMLID
jgi:hypothetical protein